MANMKGTSIRSGLYIGLMSGTSVDGIDAAMVRLQGGRDALTAKVLAHHAQPWPVTLRRRLQAAMAPAKTRTAEICELNMLAAREFAKTTITLLRKTGVDKAKIIAIGSHGQTICHLPPGRDRTLGSSLQLGDAAVIATLTGITTVENFRTADMAVGGQGAPLVPLVDQLLWTDSRRSRCLQNIGGIGNVTYLSPHGTTGAIIAFDTGPGNMLIDALAALTTGGKMTYDRDGKFAATGRIYEPMLRKLKAHEYFRLYPPKSTGRELFGMPLAIRMWRAYRHVGRNDLLATATELTAWSIAESYQRFLPQVPQETIVCGGGAENPFLFSRVQARLNLIGCHRVRNIVELGVINKAREAMAFAVLAALTMAGIPGNVPAATGARHPVVLGTIAPRC
ncbi:MAG: anhydro-N-acetylmuramic acid kinase [Phycisphaerae bacterium]